jgi:hypothetical protein
MGICDPQGAPMQAATGFAVAPALPTAFLVFPAISIHPLTRGTAQRSANSILEGRVRKRFWLSRRISPPLSDFGPF